ncbi:hypothetical protein DEO72_LG1g1563 [Vigna unguiculata]|uniref:Uncharacterized protein n=1 Tax=Vigna unguiculata TaxID=3917 RepID=A0A4D6KN11_VIGUN|nr:hypothetical protein DEO72_LG1g1563 [Vigna unguiculata]
MRVLFLKENARGSLGGSTYGTKGDTLLQMKFAYNHLAPLFLMLLQWMDFSCTCLLLRYLDIFHIDIVVYKEEDQPPAAVA